MEWGVGREPLSGGCSGGRRPPVGTSRHHRVAMAECGTTSLPVAAQQFAGRRGCGSRPLVCTVPPPER